MLYKQFYLVKFQIKQEASNLYNKLREVEEKRDALILEEKNKGTPQQERENLVQQVKF